MNVTLYYVEGISRIDTPYFATKTTQASLNKQEEFFTSKIVKTIQLSYYPPHYRNAIRFDESDLTINDNVNYLSLDYNNKKYYYFIDSVNYISESLIEVEITMDVIQTYMFDIYIANGIIERKFINRFEDIYINRNYIRENISDGDFIYYYSNILNEDATQWLIFTTTSKYYNMSITNVTINYSEDLPGIEDNYPFVSSYPFYIVPFTETYYWCSEIYNESTSGQLTKSSVNPPRYIETDAAWQFSFLSSRNWVVDMFICPFNCANGLSIEYDKDAEKYVADFDNYPNDYIITHHVAEISGNVTEDMDLITLSTGSDPASFRAHKTIFNCNVQTETTSLGFASKNTQLNIPYSSTRITQMFDENYIHFQFGSLAAFTTIPLYKVTRDLLYCHYAFVPSDGTRLYWITDAVGEDKYNTVVLDTNIIHFDLKNDPWVDYVSQNRSRYVAAGIDTAVTIFSKGMVNLQTAKFAEQEINDIKSNPKNYDRRYKIPQLKTKPSKMVAGREQDIAAANLGSKVSAISSIASNIGGQLVKDANMRAIPPQAKQIANISGVMARQAYIMTYIERVQDYEQCAQYYHRNGYLVNEYINATPDIFGYVFNRYYFNVLKMQLPNVHLHNVIEDEDTIQAISDRLVDGLRLWNVNNQGVVIGDFQYDNVENNYLS